MSNNGIDRFRVSSQNLNDRTGMEWLSQKNGPYRFVWFLASVRIYQEWIEIAFSIRIS
jgi:hypothetical protein